MTNVVEHPTRSKLRSRLHRVCFALDFPDPVVDFDTLIAVLEAARGGEGSMEDVLWAVEQVRKSREEYHQMHQQFLLEQATGRDPA